jgi:hypothetical protein
VCDCNGDEAGAKPIAAGQASDIGEFIASASRKMMHGDGEGCLADLNAVKDIDPAMDARMAVSRGQCEMLIGRCQDGKERVARWYVEETAMHPERAAITAESLASMRCREGDSSDRDRLLRALFDLSDGAYMNKKKPEGCRESLKIAQELGPKVQPRDAMDTQVSGGMQALFHTGAQCFASAGDCKTSWTTYRDLFPKDNLNVVPDAAMREKVIRDSFDSSIPRCAPEP